MKNLGVQIPQAVIIVFLAVMTGAAVWLEIPLTWIFSDALVRLAMNGVLVLSLVPMLKAGVGINFGLPIGVVGGLMGMCISVNFGFKGIGGLAMAMAFSLPVALALGTGYGAVLNRVKGKEEITATFLGFSFIPLMNFFWTVAPFSNPAMLWPIGGKGLRPVIGLKKFFAKSLNDLWLVDIAGVRVPVGFLLFFFLLCILLVLFFRTRTGRAMTAVGESEDFARLAGIRIPGIRILAVILSTIIAALGICVYAQSYGFLELYDAPLMMAFPAASAILVGGSMGRHTKMAHVVLGTFLFQTTYLISGPIANELMVPEVAEIFRLMITNGIILYALLYEGGKTK
ncbi:MAG: hypothetical protein MI799_22155 [Desulfobacterales bacterium]|nr:hypothetical protein [Desulfobacterales bacterium]